MSEKKIKWKNHFIQEVVHGNPEKTKNNNSKYGLQGNFSQNIVAFSFVFVDVNKELCEQFG